jgi:hypothetical protein
MISKVIDLRRILNIEEVKPLDNFLLEVIYEDGLKKYIDVKPFIKNGVSSALKDKGFFNKVFIDNGSVTWENGFDYCPVLMRGL